MSQPSSFDIVSKIDLQEVDNAVNQAVKEISQRYDFKGSVSRIEFDKKEKKITLHSDDESRLKAVVDVLQSRFVKRGLSLKALEYGKVETALGGAVRQEIKLVSGIPPERCKEIVKRIKDLRLKVQASIHEDMVRVSGKSKDDLQAVIADLKAANFPIPLQFTNYR